MGFDKLFKSNSNFLPVNLYFFYSKLNYDIWENSRLRKGFRIIKNINNKNF